MFWVRFRSAVILVIITLAAMILGNNLLFAILLAISVIGLRHNKYSSAFGVIKYFDAKLSLRGRTYNMISDNDKDSLISTGQKVTVNGNIVSRLVGHFFDN